MGPGALEGHGQPLEPVRGTWEGVAVRLLDPRGDGLRVHQPAPPPQPELPAAALAAYVLFSAFLLGLVLLKNRRLTLRKAGALQTAGPTPRLSNCLDRIHWI